MPPLLSRPLIMLAAAGLLVGAPALAQVAEPGIEPSQTQMNGWTINLKDADIRAYIDQMSQLTGQTFIVDPRVKGQVTVVSNALRLRRFQVARPSAETPTVAPAAARA